MALLDEVGAYLAADSTITPALLIPPTTGYNLFADDLPADPDLAVALYEYDGLPPEWQLSGDLSVKVLKPRLEVHVRGVAELATRTWSWLIWQSIQRVVNVKLGTILYLAIEPVEDPTLLIREDAATGGVRRWVFGFRCQVYKSPS